MDIQEEIFLIVDIGLNCFLIHVIEKREDIVLIDISVKVYLVHENFIVVLLFFTGD